MWSQIESWFVGLFLSVYAVILTYTAWVLQQPAGYYTATQHARHVLPAFIYPLLCYALYKALHWIGLLLERSTHRSVKALEDRLRKLVAELKVCGSGCRSVAIVRDSPPAPFCEQQH